MSKNLTIQEVMEILQDVLGKNFNFDQVGDIKTAATLITNKLVPNLGFHFCNRYDIECVGPDGKVKWTDYILNMVVDEGLSDVLDVYFDAGTQDTAWFVGLTDATPVFANADTMISSTWAEETGYTGTRPAFDLSSNGVTGSGGSVSLSNSGNVAVFAITGTATIGGAFLTSDTSANSGALLYGGDAFTGGNKAVGNGDTLNVTVTVNAATA